jgi:sugar phosphate isomerase/epimerase
MIKRQDSVGRTSRRGFLERSAALAGAVAVGGLRGKRVVAAEPRPSAATPTAASAEKTKASLAFQLYCLAGEDSSDPKRFAEAIAKLVRLGFKGVELGPRHRRYCKRATKENPNPPAADPAMIGKIIRDHGLVITSSHMFPATEMMGDRLKQNIEWHQAVGNKLLIVSDTRRYLGKSVKAAWLEFAGKLNEAAETLRPLGMATGYHSHGIDFKPIEDGEEIPWDLVFANVSPDAVMEIDYDNVRKYAAKVREMIKKYPGQARRMHFKRRASEWAKWETDPAFTEEHKSLFELCETVGKTEWYIIEDWTHQNEGWDALAGHVEFFRKIGKL